MKRKTMIYIAIVLVLLALSYIRITIEDNSVINENCFLEYGNAKLIDDFLTIPFYNAGIDDITHIKITVPFGLETNITLPADFNINEKLIAGQTGVIKLVPTKILVSTYNFDARWCCNEECYNQKMSNPTNSVYIEE
ncbi:MAG: hypothetical protein KAS04_04860 [Candidatus Aenigmarchaeota archaeon]|nr:hypothetical protein [Candidatus Aenigmarchaeota archaeon]